MILNEEEAEKRWCPFARTLTSWGPDELPAGGNRVGASDQNNCIASRCMAWRWYGAPGTQRHGFCGLAGPPLETSTVLR